MRLREPMQISQATLSDAEAITALIEENLIARGGKISNEFTGVQVRAALSRAMPVIVVRIDGEVVGVLFTSEPATSVSPSVTAMLKVWPGSTGAYVYGPVCVAAAHRGKGLLGKLFGEIRRLLPSREAVLFIQKDNDVSRAAHLKLGMREVAEFTHNGHAFLVFSARESSREAPVPRDPSGLRQTPSRSCSQDTISARRAEDHAS